MTTVCIFAPILFHALETIGFHFQSRGFHVIFATRQDGDERAEHPWVLQRIRQIHEARSISDEPSRCDLLIADAFLNHLEFSADLARWCSHAGHVAFLFPHNGTSIKRRAGHLLRLWPHSVTARIAIYVGDRRLTPDTMSPAFQRRVFYHPYIHPQLLRGEPLRRVFADCSTTAERSYFIGFIGNRNPPERSRILEACRHAIDQARARVFWIDYGDDGHHNSLSPEKYIEALGQMDFCICPAGWGGNWTHRVIESLCRGTIPILPDTHLYGLNLQDSVNCLVARDGSWHAVILKALQMPPDEISAMRRNVVDLRDRLLEPSAASRRFCEQFRIAP